MERVDSGRIESLVDERPRCARLLPLPPALLFQKVENALADVIPNDPNSGDVPALRVLQRPAVASGARRGERRRLGHTRPGGVAV